MDAIVTAGGTPDPEDRLFEYTQGKPKALLEIHGKALIAWVLEALNASTQIERIVVIGLAQPVPGVFEKVVAWEKDQGGMLENIRRGIEVVQQANPQAHYLLISSSDIPGLTTGMVDWMAETIAQSEHDFFYNVISREVMEKTFPKSNRTYLKLKDGEYCGGDLNAIRLDHFDLENPIWGRLISMRKKPLQQAALFGFGNVLRVVFRAATVGELAQRLGKQLGLRAVALQCPYAEMGMDIDKPHQYVQMRDYLLKREAC